MYSNVHVLAHGIEASRSSKQISTLVCLVFIIKALTGFCRSYHKGPNMFFQYLS